MSEFLQKIIGVFIVFSIFFTTICMLSIPDYLKRRKKKAIYEFDCEIGDVRQHISVLEKFQHHFGVETFRRLRIEYVMQDDVNGVSYGAYEIVVGEHEYMTYLNSFIDEEDSDHA